MAATDYASDRPITACNRRGVHRWFSLPDQPVAFFAGLWRPTERGDAFAFATTSPNPIVAPWHPKAMPTILHPRDFITWLDGSHDDALELVRPYDGEMDAQVATPTDELVAG